MTIMRLHHLPDTAVLEVLRVLEPEFAELSEAAALALRHGVPDLALRWALAAGQNGLAAAAALRLGFTGQALDLTQTLPDDARRAVLIARACSLGGDPSLSWAEQARALARQEGDAPALIAAVTLLGELRLTEPRAALRTLAEGLKVAEMVGEAADAHLLAVLAHAQARAGGRSKSLKTAQKSLERSPQRSPARIWALLALGQTEQAGVQRRAGQLDERWFVRARLRGVVEELS
ncbi:hypothetical protein [Deinococcus sp.]|uniref:hypothetical protein n=1 Tax=Deinococcus sp. TaxID=47478 RepID=UPI0025DA0CE4|nr:hypothetical protein [Deinococcus sp.]